MSIASPLSYYKTFASLSLMVASITVYFENCFADESVFGTFAGPACGGYSSCIYVAN